MDRYRRLRLEAKRYCQSRGHRMGKWVRLHDDTRLVDDGYWKRKIIEEASCLFCGMSTQINTIPAPNEVAIGGEAVALTCLLSKLSTDGR